MTIAYETHTTASRDSSTAAPSQTITINKPTGVADGDLLDLLVAGMEDDQVSRALTSVTAPSGFTLVSEKAAFNASTNRRAWRYRKVITNSGSEPSTYSLTVNYSTTGALNMAGILVRYSGVDTSTPVDVAGTFDGETSSTTMTVTGVTTTSTNTLLSMGSYAYRDVTPVTWNAGTKIADATVAGSSALTGRITVSMAYLAQASAGISGDKTATMTGVTARSNDGLIVALKEALSGGLAITSVTPSTFDSGVAGIVIAGNNFGASQGSSTVDIGGVAQTVTSWSNTSITITSARGSNSMGAGQLKVTIR